MACRRDNVVGDKPTGVGRCTGHCCRAFPLPFGPQELSPEALKLRPLMDGEQVAAMVTYLGWLEDPPEPHCSLGGAHYYTCKNLQDNGDCAIYEARPEMCRGYPYEGECGYLDCTAPMRCESPTGPGDKGEAMLNPKLIVSP